MGLFRHGRAIQTNGGVIQTWWGYSDMVGLFRLYTLFFKKTKSFFKKKAFLSIAEEEIYVFANVFAKSKIKLGVCPNFLNFLQVLKF